MIADHETLYLFVLSSLPGKRFSALPQSHLKLHSHHVERCGAGQDGGAGLKQAGQGRPTVPEEQGVPGQEAGAEVRFTHQDGDLGEVSDYQQSTLDCINRNSAPPATTSTTSTTTYLLLSHVGAG